MTDRKLGLLVLLLSASVLLFHYAYKEEPDDTEVRDLTNAIAKSAFWTGRYPPEFAVTLLDGSSFALADHIGKKTIILNFFATWCSPCVEEMPELNRFYLAHGGEDFVLVAIESGETESEVRAFVAEHRLAFPVVADTERALKKLYGIESFPTSILIGADGRIALYEIGQVSNADVTFAALLERSRKMLAAGRGIARDAYLEGLRSQPPPPPREKDEEDDDEVILEGRALTIASGMPCVCGCGHTLLECGCSTAAKMKKELQALKEDDPRSDEEIMREIDRKYCVGSKG